MESSQYNSVARYTCSTGYVLDGQEERVCQENGSWSHEVPVCLMVSIQSSSTEYPLEPLDATVNDRSLVPSMIHLLPSSSFPLHPDITSTDENNNVPYITSVIDSTIPHIPNVNSKYNINIFIICGVIALMLLLILFVAFLIVGVYVRRKKINSLAAASANSVGNPVYLGKRANGNSILFVDYSR